MNISKAVMAICALSCVSMDDPAHSQAMAQVVYHKVFFQDAHRDEPWEDLPIASAASEPTLARIPPVDGKFAMIGLRCGGLKPDGSLDNCVVDVEPDTASYRNVGKALIADIKTNGYYAKANRADVKFISIQIRVSNSASPPTDGPCWPPTCRFVPLPPPPPPALENR